MYKLVTTEKGARQQRQIEEAFLTMMQSYAYDDITISSICLEAKLSRKVFYGLFEKKADVLYALLDHTFLDYGAYVTPAEDGPGGVHKFFSFWKSRKRLLDALASIQCSPMLAQRAVGFIRQESPEVLHSFGADVSGFDREAMVFYVNGIFSLVIDWHEHGYDRSVDEMSQVLMRLLTSVPIKKEMPRGL